MKSIEEEKVILEYLHKILDLTKDKFQFSGNMIGLYSYLFLIYKSGSIESSNLDSAIDNISCSKVVKNILYEYSYIPEIDDNEKYLFTSKNIVMLFKNTEVLEKNTSTYTSCNLFGLITYLLKLNESDDFAEFYGNSDGFARNAVKLCKSATGYESDKEIWAFKVLRNDILNESMSLLNYDLRNNNLDPKITFSKIYSFPPIYQRQSSYAQGHERLSVKNMERSSQDHTELYIERVLASLREDGIAVILVSNAVFTRNYISLHQKFVESKELTAIINLPAGVIYPVNISASLLVFTRSKDNRGIKFFDLRRFFSLSGANENYSMKEAFILGFEDSRFISYEAIKNNNFDLNFASYDLYKKNDITASEEQNVVNNNDFILGKEASVIRNSITSVHVFFPNDDDVFFETTRNPRYLRISDIEENRIKGTMPYIKAVEKERDIDSLTSRDVVIAKVLPLKLAVFDGNEIVIPAPNLFIIRIRKDSKLSPIYLKGFLESEEGRMLLTQKASGGGLLSLSKKKLEELRIPYISEQDQDKFVSNYNELEFKIDNLENELAKLKNEQKSLIEKYNIK